MVEEFKLPMKALYFMVVGILILSIGALLLNLSLEFWGEIVLGVGSGFLLIASLLILRFVMKAGNETPPPSRRCSKCGGRQTLTATSKLLLICDNCGHIVGDKETVKEKED